MRGLEEFNAGQFFEQHETLELVWRAELRPIRDLYRGVLQIGVGCLQVERGNAVGAIKMIDRATKWLQPFRPVCQTIDVDRLLDDAARLRAAIEQAGDDRVDFDQSSAVSSSPFQGLTFVHNKKRAAELQRARFFHCHVIVHFTNAVSGNCANSLSENSNSPV